MCVSDRMWRKRSLPIKRLNLLVVTFDLSKVTGVIEQQKGTDGLGKVWGVLT